MKKFDIFLSHAAVDKPLIVNTLLEELEGKGFKNIWIDSGILEGGDNWRETINSGIASSFLFLVVLTPASLKSKEVKREIDVACSAKDGPHIVTILNGVTPQQLQEYDPDLFKRHALNMADGLDAVSDNILGIFKRLTGMKGPRKQGNPTVIGISGPSCSGKSWISRKIAARLAGESIVFNLDNYYRPLEEVKKLKYLHDNPAAVNLDTAADHLKQLKLGNRIISPEYCFKEHIQIGSVSVPSAPFIIVEGIFCFSNPELAKLIDIKIWLNSTGGVMFERRMDRDQNKYKRNYQEAKKKYREEVEPGFEQYIAHLQNNADIIVTNNRDDDTTPLIVDMITSYLNSRC